MDPFNEENEIGSFAIQNGGIATSNIVYRNWIAGRHKKTSSIGWKNRNAN